MDGILSARHSEPQTLDTSQINTGEPASQPASQPAMARVRPESGQSPAGTRMRRMVLAVSLSRSHLHCTCMCGHDQMKGSGIRGSCAPHSAVPGPAMRLCWLWGCPPPVLARPVPLPQQCGVPTSCRPGSRLACYDDLPRPRRRQDAGALLPAPPGSIRRPVRGCINAKVRAIGQLFLVPTVSEGSARVPRPACRSSCLPVCQQVQQRIRDLAFCCLAIANA